MNTANAGQLLDLWERIVAQPTLVRSDALRAAVGEPTANLGANNAALIALRARLFGPRWALRAGCPACGENCEFTVDARALAEQLSAQLPDPEQTYQLTLPEGSVTFRLPSAEDLRDCAHCPDSDAAALAVLERCLIDAPLAALPEPARVSISERMQELDSAALVSFAVCCPSAACAHCWDAALDVGSTVCSEVTAAAERVFLEVDILARAYGWSEAEVLALSPTRRAAYLQLNGAA